MTTVERGAVAVITGGANGFGRALGDRCAEHGYRAVLLDLHGVLETRQAELLRAAEAAL